ncbi:bifunctional folylpolyglutamate synthase/dihydrofolate synthase [Parapedobacter soli]|uniref:bifunctional folylpolyglutamate synthase/dihydrofolate synthase n=1 Tax=Parapedobacter soli TaxID=416955 RepID=UPI0021CA554B|nr:folylpolyglutamate synthase/dihydrofolate synthase family protein [Parapedobacter soli]
MNYEEAVECLYAQLPMFTRDGTSALKKDLTNTYRLCEALGNPHERFKSVHIAGTNGKGSTSHMLAAALQQTGYKIGLYTSPHLLDFRERIRVNGSMIPRTWVAEFVDSQQSLIETIKPSFFEVTVAMAFAYFANQGVDIAIVETGLGGRLDSTNVITPLLAIITNIGYDHTAILGNTLPEIAAEKAGIIKSGVPVIVGEKQQPAVAEVFECVAGDKRSRLVFATEQWHVDNLGRDGQYLDLRATRHQSAEQTTYTLDLTGMYQAKNLPAVLCAIDELRQQGFSIPANDVKYGLAHVQQLTGLMGRWQTLATGPLVICDTGHNVDGWREVLANIASTPYLSLRMVIGVMRDKDLDHMLPMLPNDAHYYFCQVAMPRALPAGELCAIASQYGLQGQAFATVAEAVEAAERSASPQDLVFIGGSTFIVADALLARQYNS